MIVEEQGIGFWTRVQIPSAPLFVARTEAHENQPSTMGVVGGSFVFLKNV